MLWKRPEDPKLPTSRMTPYGLANAITGHSRRDCHGCFRSLVGPNELSIT
jgi:hypothetical protein